MPNSAKIVVAEDDPVTREILRRVLTHVAESVYAAGDGLEALSLIERHDPDLLVTDLQMPDLDGFQLVEMVRANPGLARLPIICLTGVREREEILRLIPFDISAYILKPFTPSALQDRVRQVLERGERGERGRALAAG